MSTYRADTAETVSDAVRWAAESAERNLNVYVDMVERSRSGAYSAEEMTKDLSTVAVGMQQDAARVFTTCSRLLTGLIK